MRADKRHGGRADANVAAGGERRPSRHGVNTSLELKVRFDLPIRSGWHFCSYQDTHWPTHPVCFFSALSLEKNTPSESA
jgi:hypothetical protein